MTDKELDDLFQKTLSGHQMPVPPDMWQRVNPQQDKRRRTAFLWWSGLGMAALFLLVGTGVWLYHTPSASTQAPVTKQTGTQPADGSSQQITTSPAQPVETARSSNPASGSANDISSSQSLQPSNDLTNKEATDFYRRRNTNEGKQAVTSLQQNSTPNQTGIIANEQIVTEPNNPISNGNLPAIASSNTNGTVASSNQLASSAQKSDSNAIAANKANQQESKAAAVKVKKIHGEKAPSLELMVAGYGNSRHVYDASQFNATGIFAFGPINQKEKVLVHSVSVNARIDKPLTKNLSIKTGLQYLQTRQRVSYSYETVTQGSVINAATGVATITARLQPGQSIIKGTYNSLNVPLLVSYHTNKSKMNVGATAGVMMNVISWYNGNVPDESNKQAVVAKNTFRTHTGASLYAGITASKKIGNFQLFAEPHLQYNLSSITKSTTSFRQKTTSYGFGIGIRKAIGK